jgi:ubiquinone/menaquinone biosynthesis C-methylase UbiE
VQEPLVNETERVRRHFERTASRYDRSIRGCERWLAGDSRSWVCERACGEVLEIAVGTGRNFSLYQAGVRLTGVDVSPAMLAIAESRAKSLGLDVDLRLGDAQALDFTDERFDTVVCTLSLCTIADDRRAVAECRRVLRPLGRLVLLEHVRSPFRLVRWMERLLDPLAVRFQADHLLRDPLDYLEVEGYVVEQCERSKWGIMERLVARKR